MSDFQYSSLLPFHDLVAGIIAAMEARDAYTASHSMRVSDMTEIICRLLDLNKEQAEEIHIAAHVHDIGKIGIEDSILRKKSPLNEMEWLSIKQHPIIGFNILSKVNCFERIAEIVRHHHESWDGKGYPDSIQENEIPIGSRIIAIADSIDAMMSNRQYRRNLSSLQCKEEIQKNAGIMYDPVIAEKVLENWGTIIDEITF